MFFLKRLHQVFFYQSSYVLSVREALLGFVLNLKINHEKYGLKPNHSPSSAHATINDALPNHILSGKVILKQNVERFTEKGVIFEGENEEILIDDVVLATGYDIKYSFLSEDIVKVRGTNFSR